LGSAPAGAAKQASDMVNEEIRMPAKSIPTPSIRPLTVDDAQKMIDFFGSFSEQTRIFFTPHDITPDGLRKMVASLDERKDAIRFMLSVEEDGQEIMAGYVFFWDWDKLIPWFGIGLRDNYQGMGYGNLMMDFAIDLAKRRGKGGILLTTQKPNFRAQSLYKKYGYEMLGDHIHGEYLLILRFIDPAVG
jgi:ribosomal protein S18 acetylase RimI-like enzyme